MPKHLLVLFYIFFLFSTRSTYTFDTLEQAYAYSAFIEEHPQPDVKNAVNQTYFNVYRKQELSLVNRFLSRFGLYKPAKLWSADTFKNLLIKMVTQREQNGYDGKFILKITALPGTRCIVFGPLSAEFHSLMRDLQELARQGYINEQLEIIKPNTYILFNGNLINGGPYSIETLTLVMNLMEKNPENVLALKGQQEDNAYWTNFQLKRELQMKAATVSNEQVPLKRYINRFFNTLPLATYISTLNPKEGLIEVSYFNRADKSSYSASCASVIKKVSPEVLEFCTIDEHQDTPPPPVKAIIKAETRFTTLKNYTGLALIEPDKGSTAWSILSSPTRYYREQYSFTYDSFTVITVGEKLNDSTITHYFQDTREQLGFKKGKTYQITTGQQNSYTTLSGNENKPIVVGCTLDLTKGISALSHSVRTGLTLRINKQNEDGGINGRPIQVIYMNDEYSPERARKNVEDFIKIHQSSILLAPIGSATLQAYSDLVRDKKIFVFFPVTGASLFRKPDLTNLVHWSASYPDEGQAITASTIATNSVASMALIYQDDLYGKSVLEGAHKALKKANITNALELPYSRNTALFKEIIDKIKNSSVEAIGFFSTAFATEEFIRQMGVELLINKKLFGVSDLSESMFKNFINQKGLSFTLSNFVPNPSTSMLPFVQECRARAEEVGGIDLDPFVLNGYLSADLFIYILQKIQGTITHEKIRQAISSIKNQEHKGLKLNYNPATQELLHTVWLDTGDDTWIEQDVAKL